MKMNFGENAKVVPLLYPPQTVSSATATDIINVDTYDKVTFVVCVGTATVGGEILVKQMDSVGDTVASESNLNLIHYYENGGGASDTYTKNSADTISTSYTGCTVGNSDDSAIFLFEVEGSQLASSNNCLALYFNSSSWNCTLVHAYAICHGGRYQQSAPPTALA